MLPDLALPKQAVASSTGELREHTRVLSEFAARVLSERDALIDSWSSLDPSRPREWYVETARVLLDGLARSSSPTLDPYLEQVAEWSRTLVAAGLDYPSAIQEFTRFRCATLSFMLKAYPAGPELQLLFGGLDTLDRAVRSVIASVYIEMAHAQLTRGVRLRMVGQLTNGIAHSLNNLIANIIGRAQLLQTSLSDPALQFELRQIEAAARTAGENVRRVQEYAAPLGEDELTAVDVNAVIGDAVQLTRYRWRDDAEANGIVMDVVRDLSDVPPVLARRGELRDALVELVLNAVEAMPLGGSVTVRTDRVGDEVQVSVGDFGDGMEAATRAHATTPFFTTKGAGHPGLGLATVAAVAQACHGRFDLESAPGRGTTAMLFLPVAPAVPPKESPAAASPLGILKILVVDDDPSLREIAYKSLALRGHQVQMAESGPDALELVRANEPFDLVLSDLGMPGMNGFEAARGIKAVTPQTIVILMTGWAAELDAKKLLENGVDRSVHKPFDVEEVLRLVAEVRAAQGSAAGPI